jgi:archaemetzincin
MKIGVLSFGNVDAAVLTWITENLAQAFPDTSCLVIDENLPLREQAFDEKRMQYRSYAILHEIKSSTFKNACVNRVLGIVDADIFVPELNFVFGEAACPGRVAFLYMWRV